MTAARDSCLRSLATSGNVRVNAPRARQGCAPSAIALEDIACAALFAFFSMQGSIPGIAPPQAHEMSAAAYTSLSTIGGIASQAAGNVLIVLLLLRHPRLLLRRLGSLSAGNFWMALLAILAIASTTWSLEPALTFRRSVPFALAGLFGLWFASRFSVPRQLRILRLAMLATALATMVVVFAAPSIGLDHSPGHPADWQGVFTQKNACGRIMVLATATVLFSDRLTVTRALSLVLFLFVLAMSGSRGAWLIEAAILLLAILLACARRTSARARLAIAAAAPLALLISIAAIFRLFPYLAPLLGRDATLSGRTAIWAQVLRFIAQRPLLGYGYEAFWRGMIGPSLQVSSSVHFVVIHAHNGFLEILLELGAAGLVLFLLSWLRAARKLWPLWHHGEISAIAWPAAVLVLVLLYDLDENTLLIYNGLFWILYVAAVTTIEQLSRNHRHAASPAPHAIFTLRSLPEASRSAPRHTP